MEVTPFELKKPESPAESSKSDDHSRNKRKVGSFMRRDKRKNTKPDRHNPVNPKSEK